MADYNVQDVPLRVLEMLRIFLAASSRGEEASLVLETRKGKLTTKYRCVETVTGVPDPTSTNCTKKRMNPARARRSKARLENFTNKKIAEKQKAAGDTNTSSTNRLLILELSKNENKPVETRSASLISQLDGIESDTVSQKTMFYSFKSEYAEDHITDSLEEIFPCDGATTTNLVLREWLGTKTDDHLCTLKVMTDIKNFSWPTMRASLLDVFRDLRKI